MLKVMTIVGTRPEVIRLSRVAAKLDRHCRHVLVHTGQNFDYELSEVFFRELEIRPPDHFLNAAGSSAAETIGQVIAGTDRVLAAEAPDAVLVLGDTNSCLAVIAAKRRRVPVFHMEAGNRCYDFRVPEEVNRRIVDHVADINLPYSDIARQYLLREGLPPDQIITTGSPMGEVLEYYRPGIDRSGALGTYGLSEREYFVASVHREETVERPERLAQVISLLNRLAERYDLPIIVSTHPRTRQRIEVMDAAVHPLVRLEKPLGFLDYVRLQIGARAVLSDSGTITEESSILNFPAVNLRDVHERPEGFEEGAVMFVGLDPDRLYAALEVLEGQGRGEARTLRLVRDYSPLNVSDKVLRIILSYTAFVRQRVWRE